MQLKITIDCDNAAFCDIDGTPAPGPELSRILHEIADKIETQAPDRVVIRDRNGNECGIARMIRDEDQPDEEDETEPHEREQDED